jgi:Family of unknown function (DUF6977)
MAERPVFVPGVAERGDVLVTPVSIAFVWHPGMAASQKLKSIASLHEAAAMGGIAPVLEISTKSNDWLGKQLSAFNLTFDSEQHGKLTVEAAFQGSKVFTEGGPYPELFGRPGREIKRDPRLSGHLIAFEFEGVRWGLEPKTAFYDWLYMRALHAHPDLRDCIGSYAGFTDIEFNPKKSLNCQARSCALYVALAQTGAIEVLLSDREKYLQTVQDEPDRLF